jgi:hypothetical protein
MELVPKEIETILPLSTHRRTSLIRSPSSKSSIRWADALSTFWKVVASLTVIFSSSDFAAPPLAPIATNWATRRSKSLRVSAGRSDSASSAISTSS